MIVLFHVLSALSSLVVTTLLLVNPSRRKLQASYALTASTLASGTYLVLSTHTALLHSCVLGLVYLAAASIGIATARTKLARQI